MLLKTVRITQQQNQTALGAMDRAHLVGIGYRPNDLKWLPGGRCVPRWGRGRLWLLLVRRLKKPQQ